MHEDSHILSLYQLHIQSTGILSGLGAGWLGLLEYVHTMSSYHMSIASSDRSIEASQ